MSRLFRTRLRAIVLAGAALGGCEGDVPPAPHTTEAPYTGSALPVRSGLAGRLTATQHENVVQDVLGVKLDALTLAIAGGGIVQEQPSTGLFRNGADGQAAADDYPLAFAKLAAAIATRVDLAAITAKFAPCSGSQAECARAFVEQLGKRLFRRPLSEREGAAFSELHGSLVAEGLSTEEASRSVLEAMLQAPAFVFRLERELSGQLGQKRYLDGYELASRLSFFLWESAPDDELLTLADAGSLDGNAAALPSLRQQVQRLLADPRARRLTRGFVRDFAGTERAAFVGVTPQLRTALLDSMVATVDAQLWDRQGKISELFTTNRMVMDSSVAALLGVSPVGDGLQIYDVSALPQRVGWLTHPGFIAGMGDADVGKLVHRGITLMVKLMCRQPAQLPEGLAATTSDFNRTFADLTERQRSNERRALAQPAADGGGGNPACWACHSQFEPLAYGLDRFDAAGRYVGVVDAQGRELPIDGWMTDDLNVDESARARYADTAKLMTLLAQSDTVQACIAEHFLAFSTGRAATSIEKDFSHVVHAAQQQSGDTLPAMVEAVATSDLFRALAASGPAPADAEAP